jgi:hypothetical protein
MDAPTTSSANDGLAGAVGIMGGTGGTARNAPGISSGGRCEARIGTVDARSDFICGAVAPLPKLLYYSIELWLRLRRVR